MTHRRFFPVLGLLLLSACANETAAPRAPEAPPISAGITVRTVVRSQSTPLVAHVVTIDLAKAPGVLKVVADRSSAEGGLVAATVSRLAESSGLSVAVNASFFRVPAGRYPQASERADAVGGLILEGETISPKGPGLGLINAGLCIEGRNARVEKGFECRGATFGVASGPLLLWQGQPVDTEFADKIFKSLRHPRTAVGVDSARRKVWLIVADGRQEGVSEGATLDELKQMLKDEGAVDALNLDGGGSSVLVARFPGAGLRVLNVPIHDRVPGRERPVVSALGMTGGVAGQR
jgi:Phosphodiester glycosidase